MPEAEELPQSPAMEARFNTTANLEEGDHNWDEVSPKFRFIIALP